MTEGELAKMTYADKERRLDEILGRLDRIETPMDDLASAVSRFSIPTFSSS